MKVKLLLIPFQICIIIVLMIWYVYPAITEPIGKTGFIEKNGELNKARADLAEIDKKLSDINQLSQELNSSSASSKRETVLNFLPQKLEEEEIIDNLNFLVLKEELAVLAISVSQPSKSTAPAVAQASSSGVPASSATASPTTEVVQPTVFKVDLSVSGSYDKIKSLFQKINELKRYNKVSSFKLEPEKTEESAAGELKVVASLEFAYLKESGTFISVKDAILERETFDYSVVSSIDSSKNTPLLPPLQVEKRESANPFSL